MVLRNNVWYKEKKRDPVYGPDEIKLSVSLSVTLVPFPVISNRLYYRLTPPPLYIPSFPISSLSEGSGGDRGTPQGEPVFSSGLLEKSAEISSPLMSPSHYLTGNLPGEFCLKLAFPWPLADFDCIIEYLCAFDCWCLGWEFLMS